MPHADQLRPASMEDAFALVVLTLLQLCRGQISQPEWFAANLVNEPGYTPKPITEIFTSDSPFTSKNPALFTQPTTGTTSTLTPTSRPTPNAVQKGNSSGILNGGPPVQQTPEIMSQVAENPPKNELPNFLIVFDPNGQVNQQQPVVPPSSSTAPQTQPNEPTTAPARTSTSQSTTQKASTEALPPFPSVIPQQILIKSPPRFHTGSPSPILSNISPSAWPPGSVFVYPIQIPGANPSANSTALPVTPAAPIIPPVLPAKPLNSKPVLTVRVKAPKGSITNIHINPSTTVRPTTTKRRKPTRRTNTFESCMNTCNGKKEPICSSPVGVNPINPDRLKGFPSLCHMACHNSFKKEQVYEKVTDGRCGRLRTRIRPVDKKKLNKEELSKAQYTIVHNAPDTVVEFSPVRH